jgi:2-oxoisovalerate dehydrogenase E2 component (dihydrolipoyl transacylase)
MATEKLKMPQLGESVTEGTISKWLVQVGDVVKKYDPIAEVTTDKVNSEVPSSFSGKIIELSAEEGVTLAIGDVMCIIETEEAEVEKVATATGSSAKQVTEERNTAEEDSPMKKRYSPAVLRLSQEHGIDLDRVQGSGKGGRITRKDLYQLIESGSYPKQGETAPQVQTRGVDKQTSEIGTPSANTYQQETRSEAPAVLAPGDREIPVSGVRRAIATNMLRSKHEAPHAWTMVEVDVTELVNYRTSVKEAFKKNEGFNLTFLPFFIKAVVEALKEFPRVNSTWAGDKIIEKKDINISIAVATADALYVPVIKNADEKNVKGLAKSVNELAYKVRTNTLRTDDMQGGTFTVNNTGSFGSIQSQPIINYPQAAILSVESIVKRPVVINGMIAIRDMVNLCLSLDHRVLDGLIAGQFLAAIKQKLEAISKDNTSIY